MSSLMIVVWQSHRSPSADEALEADRGNSCQTMLLLLPRLKLLSTPSLHPSSYRANAALCAKRYACKRWAATSARAGIETVITRSEERQDLPELVEAWSPARCLNRRQTAARYSPAVPNKPLMCKLLLSPSRMSQRSVWTERLDGE